MEMTMSLDEKLGKSLRPRKRDMFRLPWSMNDNPIGWLEVTDR